MAEYAVHLVGHIAQKPSIFEVLAQENLAKALRNAAAHLLSYFTSTGDGRKRTFVRSHIDELVAVSDLAVQIYHLRRYGGSFSEHFYGLQRIGTDGILKRKQLLRSIAVLVLFPYARNKLDAAFAQQHAESEGWRVALQRAYAAFTLAWEALSLSFALLYAIGKSPVHSPSLTLSSVRLAVAPPVENSISGGNAAVNAMRAVADAASATLATAAFLLHFLDWWHAQRRGSLTPAPPVPPPPPNRGDKGLMPAGHSSDLCPLCHERVGSPAAAIPASGYVFCHDCISEHLSRSPRCPMTGYPASLENLVPVLGQ
ncbi:unnamed protein product [Ixodes hexagonus]